MEQIFTNTEQNIYIIKNYTELYKEDLIAEIRYYKKRYNNMNLNNIITNFKTMSNEVLTFIQKFKPYFNYLWYHLQVRVTLTGFSVR